MNFRILGTFWGVFRLRVWGLLAVHATSIFWGDVGGQKVKDSGEGRGSLDVRVVVVVGEGVYSAVLQCSSSSSSLSLSLALSLTSSNVYVFTIVPF